MWRLVGGILAGAMLSACGPSIPAGDRVADGVWITQEAACPDPSSGPCAGPAGDIARSVLLAARPDAVIAKASTARPDCAQFSSSRPCTYGGLTQPVVVVFGLADGSEAAIGLMCGQVGDQPMTCTPSELRR